MLRKVAPLLRASHSQIKDSVSTKPFFTSYQQGIDLELQNSLLQAIAHFSTSLSQIQQDKEQNIQHYWHIHKRIAHNYRRLGQNKDAEKILYDMIKEKREAEANPVLIYDDYDLLFRHLLTYDLQKGIKLMKALLQQQSTQMPVSHFKLFNFNLGSGYLLAGNYSDAKNRFRMCLESDPQGSLKVFAYNNLALSCWWEKNSLEQVPSPCNAEADKDFERSLDLFQKAIKVAENIDDNVNLMGQSCFNSADSLVPLCNLGEFLLANFPLKKVQILHWFTKALENSNSHKNSKLFDRLMIQNALLVNDQKVLTDNLEVLIQKYRDNQLFAEESFYAKIYSRVLLRSDREKSQEYEKRYKLIDQILPSWTFKIRYLAIKELNLLQ